MRDRLLFVGGMVTALALVTVLTFTAHAMGRSDLYARVLEWRIQTDSTARLCSR